MLLVTINASVHGEHAKGMFRRSGRLFHGTVAFGARQVSHSDVTAMGKENVRRHLGQGSPVQFLPGCRDGANALFLGTRSQRRLMATEANVDRGQRGFCLRLDTSVAVGARHAVADVLGVVKRDRLFGYGSVLQLREGRSSQYRKYEKASRRVRGTAQ